MANLTLGFDEKSLHPFCFTCVLALCEQSVSTWESTQDEQYAMFETRVQSHYTLKVQAKNKGKRLSFQSKTLWDIWGKTFNTSYEHPC